jgi:BirA family biotin operon repressor/biotin-[acetyl-CoA-carboxylase] ligase
LADHGLRAAAGIREAILADCVAAILSTWDALQAAEHEALVAEYRAMCATLGVQVRAALPDGSQIVGEAVDIDPTGRLLVVPEIAGQDTAAAGVMSLSAADIIHLRTT